MTIHKLLIITFLIVIIFISTSCKLNNLLHKHYTIDDFDDRWWILGLTIENFKQDTIDLDSCFDVYLSSNIYNDCGLYSNECVLWILNSNIKHLKFSKYKHLKFSRIRIVNHNIENLSYLINELKDFDLLELDFCYNNFENNGFDLYYLDKIKTLRFINNENLNLDYSINLPKNLEDLYLKNTNLKKINYSEDSTKFSLLLIENDELESFPKNLNELNQIKSLYFTISDDNIINTLKVNEFLENSLNKNLNDLCFYNFRFINNKLPQQIYNLSEINQLWVTHSNIELIDEDILKLNKLNDLDLSFNKLTTFPNVLYNLPKLTHLKLDYNDLDSISFKKYIKFPNKY